MKFDLRVSRPNADKIIVCNCNYICPSDGKAHLSVAACPLGIKLETDVVCSPNNKLVKLKRTVINSTIAAELSQKPV